MKNDATREENFSRMIKVCNKCHQEKELIEFNKRKTYADGYYCYCRQCVNAERKKYRETDRAYAKKYYAAHPEPAKERARRWKSTDHGKQVCKNSQFVCRYGITTEERHQLSDTQNHCCAICGVPERELTKALYIDHDHNTHIVRGLLCGKCNSAIGMLSVDDCGTTLIEKALAYVRRSNI